MVLELADTVDQRSEKIPGAGVGDRVIPGVGGDERSSEVLEETAVQVLEGVELRPWPTAKGVVGAEQGTEKQQSPEVQGTEFLGDALPCGGDGNWRV
jgi:hypothetical protein